MLGYESRALAAQFCLLKFAYTIVGPKFGHALNKLARANEPVDVAP